MPVSDMAAAILEQYLQDARHSRAVESIRAILEFYGCTQTELSHAIGVSAVKGRQSMVGRWIAGHSVPNAENQAMLDLLADGTLRLKMTGRDGRRVLYRVIAAEEMAA